MSVNLSRNSLEFIKPLDSSLPVISELEQAETADAFKTLFEDRVLADMEYVEVFKSTGGSYLSLRIEADDDSTLDVLLESRSQGDNGSNYRIDLTERDPDGTPRRAVNYRQAPDGLSLVRIDITNDWHADRLADAQREREILSRPKEDLKTILARIAKPLTKEELEVIEKNKKPRHSVGLEEFYALAALVSQAQPKNKS